MVSVSEIRRIFVTVFIVTQNLVVRIGGSENVWVDVIYPALKIALIKILAIAFLLFL